ncbi:tRNA lysidine(34) synthetase TilS [Salinarimonas soli]|uniref:tRNA(Ile)-lysidine synthase n=1 Tax=Salinarimonas soli TaxID=1638099 RepID=A0A5B2V749_9HYPH|nr:tRNA lysidine(34) synthetase TilS [Salinarimonas soli]KAA2234405.1 tRNA lysidine(34) synthetase TilS [Salinarimonas soli]
MTGSSGPLSLDEAARLLDDLPERVLLAVSGGPDSTALMGFAARRPNPAGLVVATVDHRLRPESAREAAEVARAAAALGLPHHVLPWDEPHPAAGLPAAARAARYRLLADLSQRLGIGAIATAHTLDDQAETVLMRLSRGTGLAGLAGMRRAVTRDGLLLLRPFLAVPKARLVAACRAQGWAYADDPTNADPRFARARWRRHAPLLAAEGLTPERLAALAERAARTEDALQEAAGAALAGARQVEGTYAAAPFLEAPFEVGLRMLARACEAAAGRPVPQRLERLEAALDALRQAAADGRALTRTVAGTLIRLDRSGAVTFAGERLRRRGR